MMASGAQLPIPLQSNDGLPRYEYLKDEQDLGGGHSTVIHMQRQQLYGTPPRDHFLWSFFTTLYFNFCCLGFMALAFSVKARDRIVLGDYHGAGSYSSTAKCLNILAITLSFLLIIIFIVLAVTGILTASYGH
ncbi:Interferon-induced transmembrane protein 2 [Varanus komodoensis]|uniref:Uncharacterized protein n=1 Tax=Varanus komodoensis TaxID=61221 RepID=A0A8D2IL47_VARKO|nr:dispanin subfamily A member 2b-like [Varanus komodoensis]KAF7245462.1 Interferon-induced transmembrane protein 2 [Varanus komodoensis]